MPYGSRYAYPYVRLLQLDQPLDASLLTRNLALEADLETLIPNGGRAYSLAILDLCAGRAPRYAERNAETAYQPGSVGKLAVVTGLMCELENLFFDNIEARWALLRTRIVKGGPFAVYDHHTIPIYDPKTEAYSRAQAAPHHEFTLYEWLDHMLSVSNNGAASIVWREAVLMRVFGQNTSP
ncbi:MAG: hypothetical protein HC821_05435 [Lewinella sp.]|nr:hypothetical protein [Lewinella sp.]